MEENKREKNTRCNFSVTVYHHVKQQSYHHFNASNVCEETVTWFLKLLEVFTMATDNK